MSSIFKTLHITSNDLYTSVKNLDHHQLLSEITFLGCVIDQVNIRIHTRKYISEEWDKYVTRVSNMYLGYLPFLYKYMEILDLIRLEKDNMAKYISFSNQADIPNFFTEEFFEYNKNLLEKTETKPMYFIKGMWIYYDD